MDKIALIIICLLHVNDLFFTTFPFLPLVPSSQMPFLSLFLRSPHFSWHVQTPSPNSWISWVREARQLPVSNLCRQPAQVGLTDRLRPVKNHNFLEQEPWVHPPPHELYPWSSTWYTWAPSSTDQNPCFILVSHFWGGPRSNTTHKPQKWFHFFFLSCGASLI